MSFGGCAAMHLCARIIIIAVHFCIETDIPARVVLHSATLVHILTKETIQQPYNKQKTATIQKDGSQIRNIQPIHSHGNLRFRGGIIHHIRNIMCIC